MLTFSEGLDRLRTQGHLVTPLRSTLWVRQVVPEVDWVQNRLDLIGTSFPMKFGRDCFKLLFRILITYLGAQWIERKVCLSYKKFSSGILGSQFQLLRPCALVLVLFLVCCLYPVSPISTTLKFYSWDFLNYKLYLYVFINLLFLYLYNLSVYLVKHFRILSTFYIREFTFGVDYFNYYVFCLILFLSTNSNFCIFYRFCLVSVILWLFSIVTRV